MMLAIDDVATRHRFTADEFHRMGDAGVFAPDTRLELLDGQIIERSPPGIPHSGIIGLLNRRLVVACGERAMVWVQNPLRLSQWSEPLPDFIVLRPAADDYLQHRPLPEDALLVIEVSDTSLRYDRDVKRRFYARHGVPEYWVVDVKAARIDAWSGPSGDAYLEHELIVPPPRAGAGAAATDAGRRALRGRPDLLVDLAGIFPPDGA
jgi:Uma2 family endonuclease